MKYLRVLSVLILGLHLNFALGAEPLKVSDAWVRASAPGQKVGAAYMTLTSSADLILAKVQSPAAGTVEIHSMTMKNGIMRMRLMETLPVPAGQATRLAPGGFHLMLFDLKKPLKAGDKVPFTLQLKDKQGQMTTLKIVAPVKSGSE
jgi:copper(I)-binding protein